MSGFISHKYKMIFTHIPRTGGRSFFKAIEPYLGEDDKLVGHIPLIMFKKWRIAKPFFHKYLKVAVWRGDKDRFKALGENNPPVSIDEKENSYWWTNYQWIGDEKGKLLTDVLLEFNNYPDCAIEFLKSHGIVIKEYPHLNKRK